MAKFLFPMKKIVTGTMASSTKWTAAEEIARFVPPVKGYLCGIAVQITTDVVKGTTTAGVLAAYIGSVAAATTEMGSLTLTNSMDKGYWYAIPLTSATTIDQIGMTTTEQVSVKMKTAHAGGTYSGDLECYAVYELDERETTTPTFGEPYHKY